MGWGAGHPPVLAAQDSLPPLPGPRKYWVDHLYPFLYYSTIDGFWVAGHYDWSSPMGFAERPEPTFGRIALDEIGRAHV